MWLDKTDLLVLELCQDTGWLCLESKMCLLVVCKIISKYARITRYTVIFDPISGFAFLFLGSMF